MEKVIVEGQSHQVQEQGSQTVAVFGLQESALKQSLLAAKSKSAQQICLWRAKEFFALIFGEDY